jgi:hypothetical protein
MVTVTGKAEVHAYIGGIPAKMQGVLKGAAKAGANVIADEIRARTPSQEVRDELRISVKTRDGGVSARIDLKTQWAQSIGTWLEYGTSPHFITVDDSQREGRSAARINRLGKEKGGDGSLVIGGNFVGKTVFHRGAQAYPVFRPAVDTKEQEAIAAAQAYINRSVARGTIGPEDDV